MIPNSMACIIISMELVILAMFLQLFFMLIDLLNVWCAVIIAEDAQ